MNNKNSIILMLSIVGLSLSTTTPLNTATFPDFFRGFSARVISKLAVNHDILQKAANKISDVLSTGNEHLTLEESTCSSVEIPALPTEVALAIREMARNMYTQSATTGFDIGNQFLGSLSSLRESIATYIAQPVDDTELDNPRTYVGARLAAIIMGSLAYYGAFEGIGNHVAGQINGSHMLQSLVALIVAVKSETQLRELLFWIDQNTLGLTSSCTSCHEAAAIGSDMTWFFFDVIKAYFKLMPHYYAAHYAGAVVVTEP